MGVPYYTRSLIKFLTALVNKLNTEFKDSKLNDQDIHKYVKKIEHQINILDKTTILLVDMNQIIYHTLNVFKLNDNKLNNSQNEYRKFCNTAIEQFDIFIKKNFPKIKKLFICNDGVPLAAKMKTQRERRSQSLPTTEELQKKFSKDDNFYDEMDNEFSSDFALPKTTLTDIFNFEILNFCEKNNTKYEIYFSHSNIPGEGEHKIFDILRNKKKYDIDEDDIITICSSDSDCIINSRNHKLMNTYIWLGPINQRLLEILTEQKYQSIYFENTTYKELILSTNIFALYIEQIIFLLNEYFKDVLIKLNDKELSSSFFWSMTVAEMMLGNDFVGTQAIFSLTNQDLKFSEKEFIRDDLVSSNLIEIYYRLKNYYIEMKDKYKASNLHLVYPQNLDKKNSDKKNTEEEFKYNINIANFCNFLISLDSDRYLNRYLKFSKSIAAQNIKEYVQIYESKMINNTSSSTSSKSKTESKTNSPGAKKVINSPKESSYNQNKVQLYLLFEKIWTLRDIQPIIMETKWEDITKVNNIPIENNYVRQWVMDYIAAIMLVLRYYQNSRANIYNRRFIFNHLYSPLPSQIKQVLEDEKLIVFNENPNKIKYQGVLKNNEILEHINKISEFMYSDSNNDYLTNTEHLLYVLNRNQFNQDAVLENINPFGKDNFDLATDVPKYLWPYSVKSISQLEGAFGKIFLPPLPIDVVSTIYKLLKNKYVKDKKRSNKRKEKSYRIDDLLKDEIQYKLEDLIDKDKCEKIDDFIYYFKKVQPKKIRQVKKNSILDDYE